VRRDRRLNEFDAVSLQPLEAFASSCSIKRLCVIRRMQGEQK